VHPLARAGFDRGIVNESTPADRLFLVLNCPPEREAAFQQLLKDLHTPGSPSYHHWLTPAELGNRFGPVDTDIETVKNWLGASGFHVRGISKARRFVEFSGSVGQVNAAFHTQIHEYVVDGVPHHANATELRIPAALAGIVATLSPLHDFRPVPQLETAGKGYFDAAARQFVPEFNLPSGWSPLLYGVAPADFYTQYNLNPLLSANITGAGVTIGVIDESNIDVGVANAYRSVFGLKANPVQVILDGGDPGSNSSQVESYLDVELAGAVAPAATVALYLSAGSPYQDPLALAAVRAVEDNQADVLSISWGAAEQSLGLSGNQFWNAVWEEAAAQGQTVLVSSGDSGQVPQLYVPGPSVSGLASTPWTVTVGGTDFYYQDYASGASSASSYWNATNDPVAKGSLKAPITEQVWNDPFGLNAISDGLQHNEIGAGSGGASSCVTFTTTGACDGGYAKPNWQTGPGVPADGVRDIPDVSLFASNGANYSGYAICDYGGACAPDASGNFGFDVVGGTSASAPAMAGIMALVVQKYGRQGQADAVLYPLAQQKPAAFHDVTLGGNWDLCGPGDSNCSLNAGLGVHESTVYSAGPGYDQASGLGSVDATQLVNNWNTISFSSTSTTLQMSPANAVHGTKVTVTTSVAPSGSGTPTGAVAILTNSTLPSNESQTAVTLSNGTGSASLAYLPGGTYQVTARYGGDGIFSSSASSPQTLTITPEASKLNFDVTWLNSQNVAAQYGVPITLSAQPVGVNSTTEAVVGAATGNVAFTVDGTPTNVPLNVGGIASWTAPVLAVGTHSVSASYSGDASFNASSTQPQAINVSKGPIGITLYPSLPLGPVPVGQNINVPVGSSLTMAVQVAPSYVRAFTSDRGPVGLVAPSGTITLSLYTFTTAWNQVSSQTITLTPATGIYGTGSIGVVTFPNLSAGQYYFTPAYSGDANYVANPCQTPLSCNPWYVSVAATSAPPVASITNLTISPTSISGMQSAEVTATVTGPSGAAAPTGWVSFYDNGAPLAARYFKNQLQPTPAGSGATFTYYLPPYNFWSNGANQITAVYSGDSNYLGSTSNAVTVNVAQTGADFLMSPQSPQVSATSGGSASTAINLTSLLGFNGTVALTCEPSSSRFSCSINPESPTLNGATSATLTITATIPGSAANLQPSRTPKSGRGVGSGIAFALCLVLVIPFRRRRWLGLTCLAVILAVFGLTSCGGGGINTGGTNPPPANGTPAGAYTMLVTGKSGSVVHTAVINVVVK
jgi:hypothetical protein